MSPKITFIERKYWKEDGLAFSIEKVFAEIAGKLRGFETEFVKLPYGNAFADILKNLLFFRPPDSDIYHVTGQVHYIALLFPPERTILTIHDIGFLHLRSGVRRFILKKLFLDWPLRRLRYVTVVSEATRSELLEHAGFARDKIEVIENPLLGGFDAGESPQFNAGRPTILQVGITPNKNIPRLLDALRGISCKLRVIGTPDRELEETLSDSGIDYEIAFGLSSEEMRDEYQRADIVAFCSTYEGFGLPILEAQAMKKPLITSDLSPLNEVSGGAAVLVDPFDVESIRNGILSIIGDQGLREEITTAGTENVKRFEPAGIARKYARLYDKVIAQQTRAK
ncbi:MAG: glycosyltransferase family 4 protein [Acidobacteria bacterium]|nr:glycosyltransferase family 4 protein [Acidobacteriota bacterium]